MIVTGTDKVAVVVSADREAASRRGDFYFSVTSCCVKQTVTDLVATAQLGAPDVVKVYANTTGAIADITPVVIKPAPMTKSPRS